MTEHTARPSRGFPFAGRRARVVLGGLLLLGAGVGAGAAAMKAHQPSVNMAPATPVAIRSLDEGIVTVRGRAVELFGNKLVLEDATGRALADLGRQGESGSLVRVGEVVTVQGRFDHGFVHAAFLVGADNKVRALGPLAGPPPHGPGSPGERCGPTPPPSPPASREANPQ